ncbi:MAG TPA: hypothetical protein PK668_26665 [Myxococcota bacterium]|nr:hypothetical protein [Myxococcota bacterium]HRY97112.1 hypothetical protein [Myxococcota bacterium]HSA23172.1 hypothetical protein [Myxococcota bacterium]
MSVRAHLPAHVLALGLGLLLALGGLPAGGPDGGPSGPFLDQAPASGAAGPLDPQRSRTQVGQQLLLTADRQAGPAFGPRVFPRSRAGAPRDGHRARIDRPPIA